MPPTRSLPPLGRVPASSRAALLGSAAGSGWVLHWAAQPRVAAVFELVQGGRSDRAGRWTLDALVVDLAACAATAVWLLMMTSAALTIAVELIAAAEPLGPRLSLLTGPAWWRRLVLGSLGLGLAAPTVGVAPLWASIDHGHPHPRYRAECPVQLDGLALPDLQPDWGQGHRSGWTDPSRPPDTRPSEEPEPHRSREVLRVTVRRGDSLWLIASRQLGATARDAAVARRSERIYAANRSTIGPDPDLILPGTHLAYPGMHPISPGGKPDAH